MNRLPIAKRVQIITLLVEGNSLRSTSRIADVSINTVTKLLVSVGAACQKFHDSMVKDLSCKRVQCDEIWSFVYAKQKNKPEGMKGAGDVWTWTAIDADTRLVISWLVGLRDAEYANMFIADLASKLKYRVQLTSDGYKPYLEAIVESFGSRIDFAQLVKIFGKEAAANKSTEKKYSPAICLGATKTPISGNPDPDHISTSYVERQNLTMRMHMRRFTRLTNAFSKKMENHCYAIALHFVYYNWVKLHKTLRITPAMASGLTKRFMSIEDMVKLADTKMG